MTITGLNELFSLEGKVALVTGAAGQLGRSFMATLREAGAEVVGADLNSEDSVEQMNVADEASVKGLFTTLHKRYGKLDVLVNNAGVGVYTQLEERTTEELERVSSVNLMGTVLCTRAARPLLSGSGSVINIASIYGMVAPDPRIYGDSGRNSSEIYGATKAGVIQLTKWFAVHMAGEGIRVNSLSPGGVFANQDEHFVHEYKARTPLGRMATERDLQGGLLYLASDASAYVTGHNLAIDGGWSTW